MCYIEHYFSSLRASVVSKLLMHKFKWLRGKGMFYLWASRPRVHASVCICVHQAQETLSPRCLAKIFLIVTKCQSCVKLCEVYAKLSSVVIAWLVAYFECCKIDVLKNSTSMIECVSNLKIFGSWSLYGINLLVTIVLIDCLVASHK